MPGLFDWRPVLAVVLMAFLALAPTTMGVQFADYSKNREAAANYLLGHYNPSIHLISESEDEGTHWLRNEYLNYRWKYNETYWLYSDNLFASYALQPEAPAVASAINSTVVSLTKAFNVPASGKFEALFGVPVGPDRSAHNYVLFSSYTGDYNPMLDYAIMVRVHNGTIGTQSHVHADVLVYQALSNYWHGLKEPAQDTIRQAASMWNGTCMVDSGISLRGSTTAKTDWGYCQNYKIALVLYGALMTGTNIDNYNQMESYLWSQQLPNGGVAALSRSGSPLGTANAETTSLALLVYNHALIASLAGQPFPVPEPTSGILMPGLLIVLVVIAIRKRK